MLRAACCLPARMTTPAGKHPRPATSSVCARDAPTPPAPRACESARRAPWRSLVRLVCVSPATNPRASIKGLARSQNQRPSTASRRTRYTLSRRRHCLDANRPDCQSCFATRTKAAVHLSVHAAQHGARTQDSGCFLLARPSPCFCLSCSPPSCQRSAALRAPWSLWQLPPPCLLCGGPSSPVVIPRLSAGPASSLVGHSARPLR